MAFSQPLFDLHISKLIRNHPINRGKKKAQFVKLSRK